MVRTATTPVEINADLSHVEINADLSHLHRLEVGILNHLASYCLHKREGKSRAGSGT